MAPLRKETSDTPVQGSCLLSMFPALMAIGLLVLAVVFMVDFGPGALTTQVSAATTKNQLKAAPAQHAGALASVFSPSVLHWSKDVETWAGQYGLDANLVATVMQIESCGDPQAESSAGAQGLFQVMPFHFQSGENPSDPATNALRGLSYLKQSMDAAQGDVRRALAGYNGGIGIAGQPEAYWPDETRRYVDWGSRIYAEAASGQKDSSALQDWLNAGGSYLCQRASQKVLSYQP